MLLSKIISQGLLMAGVVVALEKANDFSTGSTIRMKGLDGEYKQYTIGIPSFPIEVNGIEIAPGPNITAQEYHAAIKKARSIPMDENLLPRELEQVDKRQLPYGSIVTNDPFIRDRIRGLLCHVNGWKATHAKRVLETAFIVKSWGGNRFIDKNTCFMVVEHNSLELYWCNDRSIVHHIPVGILAAYGYHIGNYCRKYTCWGDQFVTGQVFDRDGFNLFVRKNNNACN